MAAAKPLSSPFKALLYLKKLFFKKIPAVILLTDKSINKYAWRKKTSLLESQPTLLELIIINYKTLIKQWDKPVQWPFIWVREAFHWLYRYLYQWWPAKNTAPLFPDMWWWIPSKYFLAQKKKEEENSSVFLVNNKI